MLSGALKRYFNVRAIHSRICIPMLCSLARVFKNTISSDKFENDTDHIQNGRRLNFLDGINATHPPPKKQ